MPLHHAPHDSELSLSEMLTDPMVQAVMACDGITRDEVEGLIRAVGRRQAEARIEPGRRNRLVSAATAFAE